MQFTDFDMLDTHLRDLSAGHGAAEAQGILCGMVCASGKVDSSQWQALVLADLDPANLLVKELQDLLNMVYGDVISGINDPECDFQLLLPGDDDSLAECAQGLAEWCQGFLLGLANGGIKDMQALPEDSREIIQDMVEISRLEHPDDSDAGAEDEKAFMEIVEYIRMGVLLINEELNPSSASPVTLQ